MYDMREKIILIKQNLNYSSKKLIMTNLKQKEIFLFNIQCVF